MSIANTVKCWVSGLWLGIILLSGIGYAQTSAQLGGTVTDQSGAVIPNANVTLKSDLSGDIRKTVTNSDGFFAIAAVPAGNYTVIIEAQGFARWERKGVVLSPGDRRTLADIVLGASAVAGSVDVTATADQVAPVDTGNNEAVITQKQIQNLSLVGRNAAELIKILPGFTPTSDGIGNSPGFAGEVIGINGNGDGGKQSFVGNYAGNGTRVDALDIAIDGARATDPGCNCATPINPNVDMIQEFKVQSGNFSAENARGPVVISGVTKGGGNEFHGTAYLYQRHYTLNANSAENNRFGLPRPQSRFSYPGFNIGGPVLLPWTDFNKDRTKLNFWVGYEYIFQRLDTGLLQSFVPTAQMRNGNFTELLGGSPYVKALKGGGNVNGLPTGNSVVPGCTDATPQNCIVPAGQIDPGGKVLLNLFPQPNIDPRNNSNGYNYAQQIVFDQNNTQLNTRVDYAISDNTKLYVKFGRQSERQPFPVGMWWRNDVQVPYPTSIIGNNRSYNAAANLTTVFNPTLTNEFIFGISYIAFPNVLEDPKKASRSALGYPYKGIYKTSGNDLIPNITSWGGGPTIINPGGFEYGGGGNLFSNKILPNIANNLTKVTGTHTLKFGAYWEFWANTQPNSARVQGDIIVSTWGGNSTGNAFADLLTGRITQYEETERNALNDIGQMSTHFYAQDAWKVKSNLTLEYGLRVARLGAIYDRVGTGLPIWDPDKYKTKPVPGVAWTKEDASLPLSGRPIKPLFWMPRVGFAYDVFKTGKTVLRGGYGLYYYADNQQGYDQTIGTANRVRVQNLCCGLLLKDIDKDTGGTLGLPSRIVVLDAKDDKQSGVHSWSFGLNQRLPFGTYLEAKYVGNKANDLLNFGKADANVVPLGTVYTAAELNDADGGNANGVDRPKRLFNKQYGFNYDDVEILNHSTYSNYNALQVLLGKQTGNINIQAAYTFSKTLGIRGAGQGPRGQAAETTVLFGLRDRNYGVLAQDRTHVLSVAYNVFLPNLGQNRLNGNKAAVAILDGWQITGISQLTSGPPLQAYFTNFDYQGYLVNSAGQIVFRADGTPQSANARRQLGSPDTIMIPRVTCDPRSGLGNDQYLNLSCFAPVQQGAQGPFIMPYMRGPAFYNNDLSVFKTWKITEKKSLQFRASAFNFLNHPLPSLTTNNLRLRFGYEDATKTGAARYIADWTPETKQLFGRTLDNKIGKRQIQMAIKFFF